MAACLILCIWSKWGNVIQKIIENYGERCSGTVGLMYCSSNLGRLLINSQYSNYINKIASWWKHSHAKLLTIQLAMLQQQSQSAARWPINPCFSSLLLTLIIFSRCCTKVINRILYKLWRDKWFSLASGWADVARHMLSQLMQDSDSCDFLNLNYWLCCQARLMASGAVCFQSSVPLITLGSF